MYRTNPQIYKWNKWNEHTWLYQCQCSIYNITLYVYKMCVCHVWLFVTPWTGAHQAPLVISSSDFLDKNIGVGCHFLLQGIFLTQGSNPHILYLLHQQADSLPQCPLGSPYKLLPPGKNWIKGKWHFYVLFLTIAWTIIAIKTKI